MKCTTAVQTPFMVHCMHPTGYEKIQGGIS